jgi:hypothetical protein
VLESFPSTPRAARPRSGRHRRIDDHPVWFEMLTLGARFVLASSTDASGSRPRCRSAGWLRDGAHREGQCEERWWGSSASR